jgi:DNA-binding protein HU-beta
LVGYDGTIGYVAMDDLSVLGFRSRHPIETLVPRAGLPPLAAVRRQKQTLKDNPLNTTELIDAVAEANDISKAKAKEVINSIVASIVEGARRGEEVAIIGFGRFAVKERPAREGRNPRTGETLKIPASKSLGFKMSKPVGATL